MISLEEAKQRILSSVKALPPEFAPLLDAVGRYASEPVTSPIDLPPFDNSAMDGYAVISEDLREAKADHPIRLQVMGRIAAGERFSGTVTRGTCVRLFTGSFLPQGANAVVMQEDVTTEADAVQCAEPARPFENVRLRGEDIRSGAELLRHGDRITPTRAGLLAAAGVGKILVQEQPRVALMATGDELVESGEPLQDGQIYESNRALLAALLEGIGISASILPLVRDDLDATARSLEAAFSAHEIVITTGGVSVGEFDFVKAAFEKLGGEIDHWKVAIRPGKPFVFGRFPGNERFLFGLPGNPVSALVTFLVLVRPALLKMSGAREFELPQLAGVLADRFVNRGDRRHFVRARFERGAVRVLGTQASHMVGSIGDANCLIDVPPQSLLEAGSTVMAALWQLPEN